MFQAHPRDNIELFWFESLESLALHLIFCWKFAGSSSQCLSILAVKDYCVNTKSEKNVLQLSLNWVFCSHLNSPNSVLKIVCIRSFSIDQHNLELLRMLQGSRWNSPSVTCLSRIVRRFLGSNEQNISYRVGYSSVSHEIPAPLQAILLQTFSGKMDRILFKV